MAKQSAAKFDNRSDFVRLRNACLEEIEEARRLVLAEPKLLEARNGTGETALHWLSIENHMDAVAALIDWGADANTQDNFQSTPLIHCVILKYSAMVQLFLSKGANVAHKDHIGESAILAAAKRRRPDMLQLVLPHLSPQTDINSLFDDWDANKALDRGDEVSALLAARGLNRRETYLD